VEQRELGRSGVAVSRLILGLGNVGGIGSAPAFFGQGEGEAEAHELMDAAWEAGITVFDTADAYGGGRSEAAIGSWLASRGRRPLVATKVFHSVEGDPADRGLAPGRIRRQVEGSLRRLGVDRIDLYLIHEPDPQTPLADTLEALDGLVRAGTVGALGASNVDGAYLEEALAISAERGLARFEWVQNSYSLLDREPEREVLALCTREGLGFTPFGPLSGGWLTGKYRRGEPYPAGSRMTMRPEGYAGLDADDVFDGLESLEAEAAARGTTTPALAIAWLLAEPRVTALVSGARTPAQLEPVLEGLSLELPDRDALSALFAP
jgi:aryl-alcohol dehydrogenase-like predicted oxidoreductase